MKKDNMTGMGKSRVFGVPGMVGQVITPSMTQNEYNNILHKNGMGKSMRKKTKSKTSKAKMMAGGSFIDDVGDVLLTGAKAAVSAAATYGVPLLLGLGRDKPNLRVSTDQTTSVQNEPSTPVRTMPYRAPEIIPILSADVYQPINLAPSSVSSIKPISSTQQVSSASQSSASQTSGTHVYKTMPITATDLNKGRESVKQMLKENPQFQRNPQNRTVLGHALQLAHKLIKDNKLISRGLKYVKYDRAAQLAESLGYGKKAKPKTVKPKKMRKV